MTAMGASCLTVLLLKGRHISTQLFGPHLPRAAMGQNLCQKNTVLGKKILGPSVCCMKLVLAELVNVLAHFTATTPLRYLLNPFSIKQLKVENILP